jgi:aminoglycoside 6'-N-acetyltransferase
VTELSGPRVRLVPVRPEHEDELLRIHRTDEVRARWGDPDPDFPWDDDGVVPCTVFLGDRIIGYLQYDEETTPMYRHASIDLFLDPEVHGRGLGREAVWLIADWLVRARGHHRIIIDPAADNEAAIRCYRSVGFRPVGRMRQYERGPDGTWHDGLLMDLLADVLVKPS